jgi:hypothetical protein
MERMMEQHEKIIESIKEAMDVDKVRRAIVSSDYPSDYHATLRRLQNRWDTNRADTVDRCMGK